MKYILLSLLFFTQIFANDTNKTVTVYGYVSEQVVHSSITDKKENYYILDAYYVDGKDVGSKYFQLLFDSNKTNITTPSDRLKKKYKLKGIIVESKRIFNRPITQSMPVTQYKFKVSSIEKQHGIIKAATTLGNYGKVKLIATSPMVGKEEAKLRQTQINHIKNIKVKAKDELLYNVNISPCLAENPYMKFSYKDIKPLSLTLEYTDNKGTVKTNTTRVNYTSKIKPIPKPLKLSQNAKSYSNQIESIKKLYGDITLIEDGIELKAPRNAENGGSVPISIRSNIKFKSIALFIRGKDGKRNYSSSPSHFGCGEEGDFSLVSQWFSTPYSIVDFHFRITITRETGELVVVLESENGKFYTIKKEVGIYLGGVI